MAARQEADGAEPRDLPTDCPSAVSENGRDESRTHQHTCQRPYRIELPRSWRPAPRQRRQADEVNADRDRRYRAAQRSADITM
jgi:hypothetical protein